jgi:hypothetical protein
VRRSKPSGPADTSAVIIPVLHLRQRGRPIDKSSGSDLVAVPMAAPLESISDAEILIRLLKIVSPIPDKWLGLNFGIKPELFEIPSDKMTVLLRIDGCRGLLQNFTFISKSIIAFARHGCRAFAAATPDIIHEMRPL